MRTRRVVGALAAAAMLVAAGCGDDDDTSSGDPSEISDGDIDLGDLDDVAGLVPDDCEFLLAGAFLNPAGSIATGSTVDPDEMRARFDALADAAPSEIEDDFAVVADRMGQWADVMGDIDMSDPASFTDPDTQAAFAELEDVFDEDYEAAATSISTYVEANCSTEP